MRPLLQGISSAAGGVNAPDARRPSASGARRGQADCLTVSVLGESPLARALGAFPSPLPILPPARFITEDGEGRAGHALP